MSTISVKNLQYVYQNNGKDFCALDNLNFTIEDGEFVSIIGHSGCGKSTLLKIFAGLLQPTKGGVYIDGEKLERPSTSRAVVFQDYSLFPWMTVLKNVVFGIRQANKTITKKEAEKTALHYLNKVNLTDAADKYPFQLSGGMRQRAAIARALAMDADILLLDEPFGALDAKIRAELQDMMLTLRQEEDKKKTVIFITHDVDEAILLGDRVLFMQPGRVTADRRIAFGENRDREGLQDKEDYRKIKNNLLQLFYLDAS